MRAAPVALPLARALEQRRELLLRVLDSERSLRRSFSESVVGLLQLHEEDDDLVVVDLNDVAGGMIGGRGSSCSVGSPSRSYSSPSSPSRRAWIWALAWTQLRPCFIRAARLCRRNRSRPR